MNQNTVENSIKVGHSTFDVVAVPQTNISQILDTTTNTKPVNVKIKIRNKAEVTDGLISVPKLTTTGPKKVRLVSSDQTIISFDIFMETENKKKVGNRKKPNYTFFKLFKPSGCFNNQNDDDIYPYIPSSSNETYRAKSASNVSDLQDDKVYDEKFALRKSLPPIASNNFLGKCKPGGCLDPPFGEDKYIYKPKNKMLAIDQNNFENHEFDEKCIEDKKNTDEVTDKPDIVLHDSPSKSSIEEKYSHSLITYPPALFSSDILEECQNKKSKPRNTDNKARISINEFSDTYFMPPKKQKIIKNDETVSIEFSETPNIYSSYDKIVVDSFTQTESLPLPKNELFNQATEPKLFSTQYISDSSQRITETNLSKDDNATVGFSELSSINIKIQNSENKSSISDVSAAELKLIDDTVENKIKLLENPQIDMIKFQGTENHNAETKTDTNLFETNLDNTVVIPSSLIYKDTIIIQDATKTAKDSRISKNRSKSNLDELKLIPNNLVDNFLQTSLDRNISCIENQSIGSSFLVNTDENEIKFAECIYSDEITLKNSNTTVIERPAEIDNLHLILLTESVELKHSTGKLNQTKKTDPSKISVKKEMLENMHQKDFRQSKQFQDVISTAIVNNEKESDTIDIISVKKYPVKTEDKKYGDQDFSTMELILYSTSEAADVQMTDHKSTRISSEATNYFSDSISTEPIESDKVSSALSNDLKAGNFIISDNIDINNEKTPALQEKISSPLQLRQKDNSNNIYYEDKQFSSLTIQSLEPTSSLNLLTPLTLPEKTSSYIRCPIKNGSVKHDNKNGFVDDQILISPSSLDLSGRAAVPSDNLEVHGPTDIVHDLIPISNVPVVIQSLQNIDIDGRHYLPTKDHFTEKEESDDGGTSETKNELQIKNSKITLLSDYKTSVTPTDYLEVLISPSSLDLSGRDAATSDNLEVQGPTGILHDLIPTSNVPVEIQSLQNIEIDGRHDLPTKDYLTEKEGSHVRRTSETKTELQIKNSKVTLLSDYKTSATPTDYLEVLLSPSSLDLSDRAAVPSDNLEVQRPTDIVHDLISTSNVPVEIQSLQNIEIDGRNDLPTKDYLTEKEGSHVRETSETKTELQIKNSKVTLLSDYKTSVTPTDYLEVLISPSSLDLSGKAAAPSDLLEVQGPTDIVHDLITTSNVPVEIQNLQNIDVDGRHYLPSKDHFTEKEESVDGGTSETNNELQIKNSNKTLLSDYKTSATPTDYLEFHRSGDIAHGLIPIHNAPLEIQTLQNNDIKNLHDLPNEDHFTEKVSDEKEILETETELQINNSSVTILSDCKKSDISTDLKVHGPGDNELGFMPISNVPVKFPNLQNIGIEDRHDLTTKDYFTEKEKPDHKVPLDTKTELQNNNNHVAIISDYKTSSNGLTFYNRTRNDAHDTSNSIASINKKLEYQSKISNADFYSKPLKLYIPKVLQAHSKETLMNVDEITLTKAEKNHIRNENSSIEINLGFYSFVNNKNETSIRTFDTSKDLRIDTQDKNITMIKSILRKNDSEIRIPVNSEMDLTLQIKKTFDKGLISKWEFDNTKKELMNKDVLLQETLDSVYENLVPVENIIQNLKKEADFLTQQQISFREILSTMKKTSQGIINKNKSCTCNKYSI